MQLLCKRQMVVSNSKTNQIAYTRNNKTYELYITVGHVERLQIPFIYRTKLNCRTLKFYINISCIARLPVGARTIRCFRYGGEKKTKFCYPKFVADSLHELSGKTIFIA